MAFEALKERQGQVWGSGPFELVEATITDMHETLVASLAPAAGATWLDVGCGTGAVAERAVRAGATVTGIDLAANAALDRDGDRFRQERAYLLIRGTLR